MPPAELPGFYFDHARNRYFPLSSKPKPPPTFATGISVPAKRSAPSDSELAPAPLHAPSPGGASTSASSSSRRLDSWHVLQDARSASSGTRRRRDRHLLDVARIEETSTACHELMPTSSAYKAPLIAVDAFERVGRLRVFVSDASGLIRSSTASVDDFVRGDVGFISYSWQPEYQLKYPALSIAHSGDTLVATGETAAFQVYIQNIQTETAVAVTYPASIRDVKATDLFEQRLSLGKALGACVIEDIERPLAFRTFPAKSDVLSLCQEPNLLYAGIRRGTLLRFDLREPRRPEAHTLRQADAPVVYLSRLREWEIVIGTMDGGINTFDLRFAAPTTAPLLTLRGHIPAWAPDLPFARAPGSDILFAAGCDARIRAWSLRTGAALEPPPPAPPSLPLSSSSLHASEGKDKSSPLTAHFGAPPAAMRAVQVGGDAGDTHLFVAAGAQLLEWPLGRVS